MSEYKLWLTNSLKHWLKAKLIFKGRFDSRIVSLLSASSYPRVSNALCSPAVCLLEEHAFLVLKMHNNPTLDSMSSSKCIVLFEGNASSIGQQGIGRLSILVIALDCHLRRLLLWMLSINNGKAGHQTCAACSVPELVWECICISKVIVASIPSDNLQHQSQHSSRLKFSCIWVNKPPCNDPWDNIEGHCWYLWGPLVVVS